MLVVQRGKTVILHSGEIVSVINQTGLGRNQEESIQIRTQMVIKGVQSSYD